MPAVAPNPGFSLRNVGPRLPPEVTLEKSEKLCSLNSLTSTSHSNESQWSNYSKQQIYKKVTDWFTVWQPWQQRMLLCGLTNRCTTSQLEVLASTLEPIFHRDFVTSLRKRYPSAPFKRLKERDQEKREKPSETKEDFEAYALKLVDEILDSACAKVNSTNGDLDISRNPQSFAMNEKGVIDSTATCTSKQDVQVPESESHLTPTEKQIDSGEDMKDEITKGPLSEDFVVTTSKETTEIMAALPVVTTAEREILNETLAAEKIVRNGPNVCGIIQDEQSTSSEKMSELNPEEDGSPEKEDEEKDEEEDELTFNKLPKKYEGPRKIIVSRPFLSSFQYAPKLVGLEGSAGPFSIKDNLGLLLARQASSVTNQQQTRQSYPPVAPCSGYGSRVHQHHSRVATANLRMTDFFDKGKLAKLGPMQTQLRTGLVHRPPLVASIDTPIQQMYKNIKWWGPRPGQGQAFVRPKKSQLKLHFKEQVNHVWQWMSGWEDYEKLNLLADIVKHCEPDLLNYFAHCLIERLHERIDISWLPDTLLLLILSYLPPSDIDSCSRVCRRWRYLSSVNELWMIKCQEYGLDQGISNLLELVKEARQCGQSVDWRLAYLELQTITEEAKDCLPIPSRLAFQGATPFGKKRVGGKFIAASEPDEDFMFEFGYLVGSLHPSHLQSSCHSLNTILDTDGLQASMRKSSGLKKPVTLTLAEPEINTRVKSVEETHLLLGDSNVKASREPSALLPGSPVKSKHLLQQVSGEPTRGKLSTRRSGRRQREKEDGAQPLEQKGSSQGPLRQLHGRKKGGDEEEEVTLDIRPKLIQAKDLMSKGDTTVPSWSAEDAKEARERLESYAGKVVPIKRVRKLQGHMDAVLCVECDVRRLISGSMDCTIRIWDIRSGRSLHKFYGHKGGVTSLKFDNETLFSGSWDTSIMVWDLVTFERREVLSGHKGSVSCLALDDKYLISGSHDGTVRVWCRQTLLCDKILQGHRSSVLTMAFDGLHIITGSSDRTIRITNVETESCVQILKAQHAIDTLWVTGELILTGNAQGHLYLWNKMTGEAEAGIQGHDAPITRVSYHASRIYTASSDGTIKEWDLMTLACVRTLQGHKGPVKDLKISSRCLVSGGADGHIRVWDTKLPRYTLRDDDDIIRMEVVDNRNGQN